MNRVLVYGFAVVLISAYGVRAEEPWTTLSLSGDAIKHSEKAYGDLEAEFEFCRNSGHGGVGLIVRAQDARHHYVVEFPFCGQQIREGHLWAAITRVDETGWAKVLMLERVPGVPGEAGLWQQARVVVKGDEIQLWVNGRPLPAVRDAMYPAAGRVGMLSWGDSGFRNLRIRGSETEAAAWDEALQPARPWFDPSPAPGKESTSGPTRAPNGDLLMLVNESLMRSTDSGRTWQKNQGNAPAPRSEYLYYDLGQPTQIQSVVLWNVNYKEFDGITQLGVASTEETPTNFTAGALSSLSWTDRITHQAVSDVGTGQVFPFTSPVTTRYLRLEVHSNPGLSTGQAGFNEFAVIGEPGSTPKSPVRVVAEHNREQGVEPDPNRAGLAGASGNTIDGSGFASGLDVSQDPSGALEGFRTVDLWYVQPAQTSQSWDNGFLATTSDGRVVWLRQKYLKPFLIEVADSADSGQTWSPFKPAGELKFAEVIKEAYPYGGILVLKDGTLLYFGYTYHPFFDLKLEDGRRYRQAPVPGMMSFCTRSTDGGLSWSDPVNIDGPNPRPDMWMSFKDGPSEVTAMETREGEIVAFVRPGVAWAMWETRSKDGGKSWTPLASGPFLSYACAAVPRATASGALVVGGRFPGLAIRVSRDNGMTWETYQIDTEIWAMGGMYEVAPDVVLWVYGSLGDGLRAQLIQITPDGVKPIQ
jgi:photosystem II stability/assembly factor-like uncharacterized protein